MKDRAGWYFCDDCGRNLDRGEHRCGDLPSTDIEEILSDAESLQFDYWAGLVECHRAHRRGQMELFR